MTPKQAYEILKNKTYKDETEKQNCLDIIKTEPECSYLYALYVMKGRWIEAEEYIKKAIWAYKYAEDVIKDRWIEAEEYIKKDPYSAYLYALYVMKGRWIEAEEYLKKDPEYASYYAGEVIKGRWIEAEEYIKKDPKYAYKYALYVMKGRWIEAEEYIKKDPQYAYKYALEVIEDRFPEAEEYITSSTFLAKYCKAFNQRLIEKEHLLKGRSKIDYYAHFNILLPEEDYNKEIANALIGKKSKYLSKIQKEKNLAKKHIQNLIKLGVISKDQTIENLIKKL